MNIYHKTKVAILIGLLITAQDLFSQEVGINGGAKGGSGTRTLTALSGDLRQFKPSKFQSFFIRNAIVAKGGGFDILELLDPNEDKRNPLTTAIATKNYIDSVENVRSKLLVASLSDSTIDRDKVRAIARESIANALKDKQLLNELWFEDRQVKGLILFPARNSYTNRLIHGENDPERKNYLTFLNNGSIGLSNISGQSKVSFNSELAAGYLGPIRMSLGSTVSESSEIELNPDSLAAMQPAEIDSLIKQAQAQVTSHQTLKGLLANGGNINLKLSLPLIWTGIGRMSSTENLIGTKQLLFTSNAFYRLNTNLPRIGESKADPVVGQELGIEGLMVINFAPTGDDKISRFKIVSKAKTGFLMGEKFVQDLNLGESRIAKTWRFEFGIIIDNSILISYSFLGASIKKSNNDIEVSRIGNLGVSLLNF